MKKSILKEILDYRCKNKMLLAEITFLLIAVILNHSVEGLMLCLMLFFYFLLTRLIDWVNFNQLIKKKSLEDLREIVRELQHPLWVWGNHFILTDSYLIKQKQGVTIINISDIVLVYTKKYLSNKQIFTKLVVVTKKHKKSKIVIDSTAFIREFENIIKRKNPEVLFGYNLKNIRTIRKKYSFIVYR